MPQRALKGAASQYSLNRSAEREEQTDAVRLRILEGYEHAVDASTVWLGSAASCKRYHTQAAGGRSKDRVDDRAKASVCISDRMVRIGIAERRIELTLPSP